ncbi:helix-turn-helix domain-containing protein [uncultured Enterococcus sp.]|uniref:helix-turn-helix domain-containing protein n=1 Tax=uncultured Enterococcus sp. TaxID=167972 RepID=UPI002AA7AACF|nr:helix-turn-helix domain-containing protein [uncultured Enterococcus sp.]
MYSLAKRLITEKDIRRKVALLENLVNHPQLTARELAERIQTTQRTVFNDIQGLRMELPEGWSLEADGNNGLSLTSTEHATTNEVWEYFMKDSISIQIVRELLSSKSVQVQSFLHAQGISFETLKRHLNKLNKELKAFQLKISVSAASFEWAGDESSIRIFYHRLLLPFTHNNFFFDEYPIHQANYAHFLRRINRTLLKVDTEEVFGTCWFFINTIRIKSGCLIEDMTFEKNDILFNLYQEELEKLYTLEGIHLNPTEAFFAFFAFMESWNYSTPPTDELKNILLKNYELLYSSCGQFMNQLIEKLHQPKLEDSPLLDNLVLFLLKYYESRRLSDRFLLEYQELFPFSQQRFPALYQLIQEEVASYELTYLPHSGYVLNTITLLVQEAMYLVSPKQITAYFLFQGEPAWKNFLFRELQDLTGNRVQVEAVNTDGLENAQLVEDDLIISNYPLAKKYKQTIVYISSIPTQNELQELRELIVPLYL